jgi:hypothetical protein
MAGRGNRGFGHHDETEIKGLGLPIPVLKTESRLIRYISHASDHSKLFSFGKMHHSFGGSQCLF